MLHINLPFLFKLNTYNYIILKILFYTSMADTTLMSLILSDNFEMCKYLRCIKQV